MVAIIPKGVYNMKNRHVIIKKNLEIAIRKRRFFSHPVILRGLMPRRISN